MLLHIPATSIDKYISGIVALNIPSSRFTGDWHLEEVFFNAGTKPPRSFMLGEGCEWNTNIIWNHDGIIECSNILRECKINSEMPVYAAAHHRAICDMIWVALKSNGSLDFINLDDWMPRLEDKLAVFKMLEIVYPKLSIDELEKLKLWQTKNLD